MHLIEQIHASPLQIVLAATGGGSQAISRLLEVSGASRTVLEAVVPYAGSALAAFLGRPPDQFCSSPTARAMAMAGFQRGGNYQIADLDWLAGVGATAALASDRPKRGPHRLHVAVQTLRRTHAASLTLAKGTRTRSEEERLCAEVILNEIAAAAGLPDRLPLDLRPGEQVEHESATAEPQWVELLRGTRHAVSASPTGVPPRKLLLPGAFNPLHAGHRAMLAVGEEMTGAPAAYELSIENVDKPLLDYLALRERLAALGDQPVWLTRAPTFVKKSRLFPGATFLVGADTITRIADPRYYGDSAQRAAAAIDAIAEQGCQFLVFGRLVGQRFVTLAKLSLPERLRAICHEVPAEAFRNDVSSTELRRATAEQMDD